MGAKIKRIYENIKRGLRLAGDLIIPRACVVCERNLLSNEHIICLHCLADIPFTRFWVLEHNPMADRFNAVIQDGLLVHKRNSGYERYAFAAALFFYSHDADYRRILYNLKYEGRVDVGKCFGNMLGRKLATSAIFEDVDCVIPVPLHWIRRWRRGYNQAEIIAQEVAAALGAGIDNTTLRRCRRTKTQTKLDIEGKSANVSGAFTAQVSSSVSSSPKHILLIDDVFTTGSTLYACFVALREVFPPRIRISVATLGFVGEA